MSLYFIWCVFPPGCCHQSLCWMWSTNILVLWLSVAVGWIVLVAPNTRWLLRICVIRVSWTPILHCVMWKEVTLHSLNIPFFWDQLVKRLLVVEKITEICFFLRHEVRFNINLLCSLHYVFFVTEYTEGIKIPWKAYSLCY